MVDFESRNSHKCCQAETEKTSYLWRVQGENEEEGRGCTVKRKIDEEQKFHNLPLVSISRKLYNSLQTQIQLQCQQLR